MVQIIEMTDKEKLKMYMKLNKKELAKMLIQCNKIIEYHLRPTVEIKDNSGVTQFRTRTTIN